MKKKTSHPQQESVSTYRREISIAIFLQIQSDVQSLFFFFWRWGGGGRSKNRS